MRYDAHVDQDFENWATAEIAKLRTEADAIERALTKFRASQQAKRKDPLVGVDDRFPKLNGAHVKARKTRGPGAKTGAVVSVLKDAGDTGLTNKEITERVAANGVQIGANSLRSMLWNWQRDGKIVPKGNGRKAWVEKEVEIEF